MKKLKENLTCSFKNDMRTLVNFHRLRNSDFIILESKMAELIEAVAQLFCKKGALENFAKITGKHLCQSLFKIKLQASGLQFY